MLYVAACLILALFLVSCAQEQSANGEQLPTTTPAATSTPRPAATATSLPTPTASPEPILSSVSAEDQVLDDDGELVIDRVIATEPAWLVIHSDEEGDVGPMLGYTAVKDGESEGVTVTVDPLEASPILHVVLHMDAGEAGVFEYPGPDVPLRLDSDVVMSTIEVNVQAAIPAVTVSDQELTEEGMVVVDKVVAASPGWLGLHIDLDGRPGQMLAYQPVHQGDNEDVTLSINMHEATPTLHAILYQDLGEVGRFDYQQADTEVFINDNPVESAFEVVMPPDIYVLNQPVVDGSIVVERVVSYGPGWVVVYDDDAGEPGLIIGWASLEDGVNELVKVPVTDSAVTSLLHLILHQDLETVGQFGFPRTDPLVQHLGKLPEPATFQTDASNYLIARDQSLGADDTITVDLAVVDQDGWIVIQNDEDGQPGEILGNEWIPAGISRNTAVEIDPELVTPALHVTIHVDAGTPMEFEYPDSYDIPFQRNRRPITAPIELRIAGGE